MKVYLDPSHLFNGRQSSSDYGEREAIRMLRKALKKTEDELKASKDKKPDDKKKEDDKVKLSVLELFILITGLSFAGLLTFVYLFIGQFAHLVEILHK